MSALSTSRESTNDKSKRILAAALHLIAESGFQAATTDLIAREAGVAAGTVFLYFASKDALILELYRSLRLEMMDAVGLQLDRSLPVRQLLRLVWLRSIDASIESRRRFVFLQQFHHSPYSSLLGSDEKRSFLEPIFGLVETAMQKGLLRRMPYPMFEIFFLDSALGLARLHFAQPASLDSELKMETFDSVWKAISA